MDSKDMDEFRELTLSLTSIVKRVANGKGPERVEYIMENGEVAVGENLAVKLGEYSIQRCECPPGLFIIHEHPVWEWVLLIKGEVTFESDFNGDGKPRKSEHCVDKGFAHFPDGTKHQVTFHKPSVVLGVAIPEAPGYPGVE